MAAGDLLVVELHVDHVEDLCIDDQHEQQRRQHPPKEVEVNHVFHADDVLEPAGDDEVGADGAVLLKALQVVPAQHGREPHDEGHRPAEHHRQPRSPTGHHSFVPASTTSRQDFSHLGCVCVRAEGGGGGGGVILSFFSSISKSSFLVTEDKTAEFLLFTSCENYFCSS